MPDFHSLAAEHRDRVGKGSSRAARRNGRVPAVIYGLGAEPTPITLAFNELLKEVNKARFLGTLFEIEMDGEKQRVIPRDVQYDVVKDLPTHVDFLRIGKDTKIDVAVPVHFINEEESPGLEEGGVLNVVRHEIDLACPVESIPEMLTADLTGLVIGDSIHISDIKMPEGVTPTITDRDFTVATIAAPTLIPVDEEEEEAEGEEGEEGAEGEEGEGEAEGEGGEEAAEGDGGEEGESE
ncbi:MAG: 50S ribosomal protein L25/general stress protein Ctc [Alphaproteobacteria bacterium]|nr:50S ribosomal protein L25/general stress protein Ctc [Alphaproteobacteria bacterium]